MKTFLHYGVGYIKENYGIEALTRGTEVMLEKAFPNHIGYFICNRDVASETDFLDDFLYTRLIEADSKLPNFKSRLLWHLFKKNTFPELTIPRCLSNKIDCALGVGGDIYTLAGKDSKNWVYPWPVVNGAEKLMNKGIPYALWCASVGPFESAGRSSVLKLQKHLGRASAVIVREEGSYNYLTQSLKLKNVTLAADPSFFMEPLAAPEQIPPRSGKPLVAVNVSPAIFEFEFGPSGIKNAIELFADYLTYAIRSLNIDIILVPHTMGDFATHNIVKDIMRRKYQQDIHIVDKLIGSPKTKWLISQCNALIATRFHCCLAGIDTETPTVLIGSQTKKSRLYNDIFTGSSLTPPLISDMNNFSKKLLCEKVAYALQENNAISFVLESYREKMKERGMLATDTLKRVLGNA